jgi:hypothetical protein
LSWGICRRDLRGVVEPGDTVVFIAHRKHPNGVVDYRWTGFATVAAKIRQTDIWECQDYAGFRRYLNLLIRPDGRGSYTHVENHPGQPHPDWLWRLTRSKGHRWKATDFSEYTDLAFVKRFVPGKDRAANGELIVLSPNYVIFSTDETQTVLLANPPVVAEHRPKWGPQLPERWASTPPAQWLNDMTLGLTNGRTLRLTTSDPRKMHIQQRHRHIKISNDSAGSAPRWRENALRLLRDATIQF